MNTVSIIALKLRLVDHFYLHFEILPTELEAYVWWKDPSFAGREAWFNVFLCAEKN